MAVNCAWTPPQQKDTLAAFGSQPKSGKTQIRHLGSVVNFSSAWSIKQLFDGNSDLNRCCWHWSQCVLKNQQFRDITWLGFTGAVGPFITETCMIISLFFVSAHCKSGPVNVVSGPENRRHSSGTVHLHTCQVYSNIWLWYFKEWGDQIRRIHSHTRTHRHTRISSTSSASSSDAWQLLALLVGVAVSFFSTISDHPWLGQVSPQPQALPTGLACLICAHSNLESIAFILL